MFAFLGVLGYLTHRVHKHLGGGLHLRFGSVLAAGGLHRFHQDLSEAAASRRMRLDVRTVLAVDDLSPSKAAMLEQGQIAAGAVLEWFRDGEDLDEGALAERIPTLPRHEDSYPARAIGAASSRDPPATSTASTTTATGATASSSAGASACTICAPASRSDSHGNPIDGRINPWGIGPDNIVRSVPHADLQTRGYDPGGQRGRTRLDQRDRNLLFA